MSTITKLEIRITFLGGWTELSSRVFSVLPCASLSHVPCLHFSFCHEMGSDLAGTAHSAGQEQTQPVGSCREHGEEINLCGCKPLRCGEFVTINWPTLTHTYILGSNQYLPNSVFSLFLWCQLFVVVVSSYLVDYYRMSMFRVLTSKSCIQINPCFLTKLLWIYRPCIYLSSLFFDLFSEQNFHTQSTLLSGLDAGRSMCKTRFLALGCLSKEWKINCFKTYSVLDIYYMWHKVTLYCTSISRLQL